jgi:hypothetical protein
MEELSIVMGTTESGDLSLLRAFECETPVDPPPKGPWLYESTIVFGQGDIAIVDWYKFRHESGKEFFAEKYNWRRHIEWWCVLEMGGTTINFLAHDINGRLAVDSKLSDIYGQPSEVSYDATKS